MTLRRVIAVAVAVLALAAAQLLSVREKTLQHEQLEARAKDASQRAASTTVEQLLVLKQRVAAEADSAKRMPQFQNLLLEAGADTKTIQDWMVSEAPWQSFRERGPTFLFLESTPIAQTGTLPAGAEVLEAARAIANEATASTEAKVKLLGLDGKLYTFVAAVVGQTANGRWGVVVLIRAVGNDALTAAVPSNGALAIVNSEASVPVLAALGSTQSLEALKAFLNGAQPSSRCCIFAAIDSVRVAVAVEVLGLEAQAETAVRNVRLASFAGAGGLTLVVLVMGFLVRSPRKAPILPETTAATSGSLFSPPVQLATLAPVSATTSSALTMAAGLAHTASTAALSRYRTVDLLGEGGMAQVFVAEVLGAEGFRRLFVVKRLRAELAGNTDAVAQFIDEGRLGASLVHSNIVPVFDFGRDAEGYFLAQEYILGRSVDALIRASLKLRSKPLETPVVLYLAQEALKALSYAHSKTNDSGEPLELVHRDVSPNNLMVSARGEVKLLDFGIVKGEQRLTKTQTGMIKGNLFFMSPEQARAEAVDARSDLFSLGMVLFYAAVGETLYDGKSSFELLTRAAHGISDADRKRIDALDPSLAALLQQALNYQPDARYSNAEAFSKAVSLAGPCASAAEVQAIVKMLCGDELAQEIAKFRERSK